MSHTVVSTILTVVLVGIFCGGFACGLASGSKEGRTEGRGLMCSDLFGKSARYIEGRCYVASPDGSLVPAKGAK